MSRASNKVHIDDVEKAKRIQARSSKAFAIIGTSLLWLIGLLVAVGVVLFFMWNTLVASIVVGMCALVGGVIWWASSVDWAVQTLRDADFYGVRDD